MKTTMREKMDLDQLNAKCDSGNFSHKYLRILLYGEKHFSAKHHKKGKFFTQKEGSRIFIYVAPTFVCGKDAGKKGYMPVHSVSVSF